MAKFDSFKNAEVRKALVKLGKGENWVCNEEASREHWEEGARDWMFTEATTGALAKAFYKGRGRHVVAELIAA